MRDFIKSYDATPKKKKWIFRKELWEKARKKENRYFNADDYTWQNKCDGKEVQFNDDGFGLICDSVILKGWCEEVEQ